MEGSLLFFNQEVKSLPSSRELCPSFIFLAYGQQKVSASDRVKESYIWLNYSKLSAKGKVCRGTAESCSWVQWTSAQDLSAVPHFTGTLCSTPEDKLFWEKSVPWCLPGLGTFLQMTAWELSGFSALLSTMTSEPDLHYQHHPECHPMGSAFACNSPGWHKRPCQDNGGLQKMFFLCPVYITSLKVCPSRDSLKWINKVLGKWYAVFKHFAEL